MKGKRLGKHVIFILYGKHVTHVGSPKLLGDWSKPIYDQNQLR